MPCPYLTYRDGDERQDFDHDRAFCTVEETFVSPMRADVCNGRYDFDHRLHCDVYRRVTGDAPTAAGSGAVRSIDVSNRP